MTRKKVSPEVKLDVIEHYLQGNISKSQAARQAGANLRQIKDWLLIYDVLGPQGFFRPNTKIFYSPEIKRAATIDYLAGEGTLNDIARKYQIHNQSLIGNWIKVYNDHGNFKTFSGGSKMKHNTPTTQDERYTIVLDCLAHSKDYGKMALKYSVAYNNVIKWVKKYEEFGYEGLEDRRGKRLVDQTPRTKEEKTAIENLRLKKQIEFLKMEVDFLKKLEAVERRNRLDNLNTKKSTKRSSS